MSDPTFTPKPRFSILRNQSPEPHFRAAAITGDDRGHSIQQEVIGPRNLLHRAFDMGMDVDKPGRENAAPGIDRLLRRSPLQPPNIDNPAVPHPHVTAKPGVSRAIDYPSVADQNVIIRRMQAHCDGK